MNRFRNYLHTRRYSKNTIVSYLDYTHRFILGHKNVNIAQLSDHDIQQWFYDECSKHSYSRSTQNVLVNAIKLYFKIEFNRDIEASIRLRPMRSKRIPEVFSQEEITVFFQQIKNAKHRMMFFIIYSGGLRLQELLNLRLKDIDSTRMVIRIIQSKGAKDREVPLSEKLLFQLRTYYRLFRPKNFLIEGRKGGAYSATSVQKTFKQTLKKTGIKKNLTVHSLRHSYATHLLESGVDIRIIQELLGHASLKTTEIYTHVSTEMKRKIPNPLDQIKI